MAEFICPHPENRTEKSIVVMKKRKLRGNIRDRSKDSNKEAHEDDVDDIEEISIAEKLTELKNDQSSRIKRQKVISTLDLSGLSGRAVDGQAAEKSMKEMIGAQFASQENQQCGGAISHDNLLEKYIKEKTGQLKDAEVDVEMSEEELLYRVPQEIKDMEGRTKADADDSEDTKGQAMSSSMGITEVALPETYKLSNIAATEEAKRKKIEDKKSRWNLKKIQDKQKTLCLGNTAVSYIKRQMQEDWKAQRAIEEAATREYWLEKDKATKKRVYGAGKVSVESGQQGDHKHTQHHLSNFEKSTDNATMGRFCKNERRRFSNK